MRNKSVTNSNTSAGIDHDNLIGKNFWGYFLSKVTVYFHHLISDNAQLYYQNNRRTKPEKKIQHTQLDSENLFSSATTF